MPLFFEYPANDRNNTANFMYKTSLQKSDAYPTSCPPFVLRGLYTYALELACLHFRKQEKRLPLHQTPSN